MEMGTSKTMKSPITSLALKGIVAMILIVASALSITTGDRTLAQCNSSNKSNCKAYRAEINHAREAK